MMTSIPAHWIDPLLDTALKSFVLLVAASGFALLLKRASAATRHFIWFSTLVTLLGVPLLSALLPPAQRQVWSLLTRQNPGNEVSLLIEFGASAAGQSAASPAPQTKVPPPAPARDAKGGTHLLANLTMTWITIVFLVWSGVAAILLLLIGAAELRVRRLARRACQATDEQWLQTFRQAGVTLRLKRPVLLFQSDNIITPLTAGWWRPFILLPPDASHWNMEVQRIVLLHELGHVKRWDCLTQLIARIVCALFWFNPLVWLAARRMCLERERACDDLVLNAGCQASEYATHLLQIAKHFRRPAALGGIAMARPSGLRRRVTVLLDQDRQRKHVTGATAAMIIAVLLCFGLFMAACTRTKNQNPPKWSLQQSEVGE